MVFLVLKRVLIHNTEEIFMKPFLEIKIFIYRSCDYTIVIVENWINEGYLLK
jgi:hypothetical protein|tara:strand:- start:351 stop:506 length:156 start_codon:yes stop_codon:yes gene_type:complete